MGLFPEWTWIVGLMLGATFGSFLNVVIYRIPRGLSLVDPAHSFCPNCRHQLSFAVMIPLFSYLFSAGKCHYCKVKIPIRYFLVELLNGGLWAVLWYQCFIDSDQTLKFAFYAAFVSILVAIIFIDWELYIIPDELNAALLFVAIGYHAFNSNLQIALTGALAGWAVLWGIAFLGRIAFKKDAMGHGDIKMMRGVGALIGPMLLYVNMGVAVILGLVVGVALIAYEKSRTNPQAQVSEDLEGYEPEPIQDLVVLGLYYLLCLDVLALFFPGIEKATLKLLKQPPAPETVEEDNWTPSLTTIPFGPYLAAGAIVCMLFTKPIESAINAYLESSGLKAQSPSSSIGYHQQGENQPWQNKAIKLRQESGTIRGEEQSFG